VAAHENLAVGMAHGFYLITGRPQAVMCHVSVGSANAVCAILNAASEQVPVIFLAGRTPLFERDRFGHRSGDIHWPQEMYDQAGMLREAVKWDYELRDGLNVADVVDRAYAIAEASPPGPIYLTLPREVLAQSLDGLEVRAERPAVPSAPFPDPAAVAKIAERLALADFPVIVTSGSGIDPSTVAALGAICERYGIAQLDRRPRFVNLPTSHPMHLVQPIGEVFPQADALLFLECDVPWLPAHGRPRPDAFVADAGTDPLFSRIPIRSFPVDVSVTSSSAALLAALDHALGEAGAERSAALRRARIAEAHAAGLAARDARLDADAAKGGPITKLALSRALDAVRDQCDIVVNEYSASFENMRFDEPGTWFNTPGAAGLGWGLPAALGAQLAAPERTVIAVVGDGAYMFANPAACHHAAAMHKLPVLTIVYNNARWEAVQSSARGLYGSGTALSQKPIAPLSSLDPIPDFEKYAEASGGYAERVTDRAQLVAALRRALDVVRTERRAALLNVIGS
jgi:acetolactate synthase-1/2/3 large subunit